MRVLLGTFRTIDVVATLARAWFAGRVHRLATVATRLKPTAIFPTVLILLIFVLALSGVSPAADDPPPTSAQINTWIEVAEKGDQEKRLEAIRALADAGDAARSAVPALTRCLQDTNPEVRGNAAIALSQLGLQANTVLPVLARMFNDSDESEDRPLWAIAGVAAGSFGSDSLPYLIDALRSEDRNAIRAGGVGICILGTAGKDALPALTEALKRCDVETRCPVLMNALLRLGPEAKPALPLLLEYLDDEDFHTQYWTCRVLGAIGSDSAPAVPKLIELVGDGVASVRRNAVAALGDIGPVIGEPGLAAVIDAVNEPFQPVRENAVIALGKLGDFAKPAVPTLESALSADSSLDAKAQAAKSLWLLKPESKLPLSVLLADLQGHLGWRAADVLGEIGPQIGAVQPVTQLLESPKATARAHAAMALELMGSEAKGSVAALEKCLQDSDEEVREMAAHALEAIRASDERAETPKSRRIN